MRRIPAGLLSLALAAGTGVALGAPAAAAAPADGSAATAAAAAASAPVVDELPNPREEKRRALREAGLSKVLTGEATAEKRGKSTVVKVGEEAGAASAAGTRAAPTTKGLRPGKVDQYVELSRETTDKIFVILAEFGDERHPDFPDKDTDPDTPGPQRFDGPRVNEIPEPDRRVDNSTVWRADFSRSYFQDLYFGTGDGVESVKTYYEKQSSGRYSVDGMVSDWVRVPYNEARYGRSGDYADADPAVCASNVCSTTWELIQDAVDVWVQDQEAAGRTDAQIRQALAEYDVWDRYDADGDGEFNEPDGYIDHFQIVHAGGDEADGDPYQGEDAIWSHRWKAFQGTGEGPEGFKDGGAQIGDTGFWVADYTIQPENGGVSVFVHEYGHDLGLPDHYDTSQRPGEPENGVNWWTLMAQSRVSAPEDQAIGTRAADLGAWDKLQLGWLDYEVVPAGTNRTLVLGPHEYNSAKAQAVVVPLPPKEVSTELAEPVEGERTWWSGSGDDLSNSVGREVTLPTGDASLSFQAQYDIEDCGADPCDYAYVEVDAGDGWTAIPGSITKPAEGNGIDGTSDGWVPATFDLSAYAGQTIGLRVAYRTDGAVAGKGFFVDDLTLTAGGTTLLEDGAEDGDNGWSLDGFSRAAATDTTEYPNFYIASNRVHVSYDRYLATGPYNFGFPDRPDFVEHFAYEQGLLVSYWDTSQTDNNTNRHPGEGLVLPVDAHPQPIYNLAGTMWRPRVAGYDAPFSLKRPASFTLHVNGVPSYIRGKAPAAVFDDRRSYWSPLQPTNSVKVPNAGVRMQVLTQTGTSMKVKISSTK